MENHSVKATDHEVNLVAYYKDLLIKAVPAASSSIMQCALSGWLQKLGETPEMDSIRLFLYDDRNNTVIIRQVFGDKEIWRDVDITRFRKEKTKYKHLFFVKIRHIRENGQFLVLGYLAFHTEKYVTDDLLESLDVLCMLYGNYIVKRLVASQTARMNTVLPKVYTMAASDNLPGTKIKCILECLHGLAGANYGFYCTIHGTTINAEYFATKKKCSFFRKQIKWVVSKSFVCELLACSQGYRCPLSEMPRKMIDFILYKDARNPDTFSAQFIPVIVDGEMVGLWLFVYSENNPFISYNIISVLEGVFPLLKDSYRFYFKEGLIR